MPRRPQNLVSTAAVLAAVGGCVLAACANDTSPSSAAGSAGTLRVPTSSGNGAAGKSAALGGGTVEAAVSGDWACFWIANPTRAVVIIWPKGYTAIQGPLRVLDQRGSVVVTAGQTLASGAVGGGFMPVGRTLDAGPGRACPATYSLFGANTIRRPTSGSAW